MCFDHNYLMLDHFQSNKISKLLKMIHVAYVITKSTCFLILDEQVQQLAGYRQMPACTTSKVRGHARIGRAYGRSHDARRTEKMEKRQNGKTHTTFHSGSHVSQCSSAPCMGVRSQEKTNKHAKRIFSFQILKFLLHESFCQ